VAHVGAAAFIDDFCRAYDRIGDRDLDVVTCDQPRSPLSSTM
jgi:hypothetical protein